MLKVLSQNKINSILAECQTPGAVKMLSYTKNSELCEATAQTVYNVFSDLDFFRKLGGKEQPQYAVLPDGNVILGLISTRLDDLDDLADRLRCETTVLYVDADAGTVYHLAY